MIFVSVKNLVPFECDNMRLILRLEGSLRQAVARVIPAIDNDEENIVVSFAGFVSPKVTRIPVLIRVEGISDDLEIKGDLAKEVMDAFKAVFQEARPNLHRKAKVVVYKPESYLSQAER
jgi:hypothetical protein